MEILVDNREPKRYYDLLKSNFPDYEFKYIKIEEGDYVSNRCIVERKTISDLHSSILNGRLKSQLNRILTHNKIFILFIVGDINHYIKKMKKLNINFNMKMVYHTLASAIVRNNVHIIWVNNELDGFNIIIPMMDKFEKGLAITPTKINNVVIISKLFNVSKQIAIDLINKFQSIENMVNATEKDFMEIKGIGKVKSKQIKNILKGELNSNCYV